MAAADKVLDRHEIARRLESVRSRGGIIVFTCGVFDLLHVGHVRYLEFARGLGDALVVGVNSDASVKQLAKGAGRPIVPDRERAEIVAALASVDFVCVYDELRPNATIEVIRPRIHVKDAAYQGQALPEAAAVQAVGGEVRFAPHVAERSTTLLLQRLAAGKTS